MASSNFRSLEATNRRETAVLVVAFMLLFGALGLGLDFAARDIAIIDGHLIGFPVLTIAALVFAGMRIDRVILQRRVPGAALGSRAPTHA